MHLCGITVSFCVKSAFLEVQQAHETLIHTVVGGFQNSNLEACRCNNICHQARFHRFKIEKHMHLSGLTVCLFYLSFFTFYGQR